MLEQEHRATRMAREFAAKHGPENVDDGTWIYYPDGASREVNPLGAYMEPPADNAERCRVIVHYHKVKVARLVRAFDTAKQLYKQNASMYSHEEAIPELKRLKSEVMESRSALQDAEEAERYARTGRTLDEERRLQQMDADHAAERERQRKELDGINV